LSVSGPDQIGNGHPLDFVGRSRGFLEITPKHLVAELVSELEALDQPVPNLLVRSLPLVAGEALAKTPHSIAKRGDVQLHSHSSLGRDSGAFAEVVQAAVDQSLVSFSCAPSWKGRRRRVRRSAQPTYWSWLE
jgi:hypothetical protein